MNCLTTEIYLKFNPYLTENRPSVLHIPLKQCFLGR